MTPLGRLRLVTVLTVGRYPLVLGFFGFALLHALSPRPWLWPLAMAWLVASAVTDWLDGYLARRFDVQTPFGAHADPLMDKFFYLSTLPLLVFLAARRHHEIHAVVLLLLTVAFLARDQWVTFLRALASLSQADVRAHWSGKLRTAVNFPLIILIYAYETAPRPWIPEGCVYAAEGAAFVLNLVSVYFYSRHYWVYVRRSCRLRR